MTAYGFDEPRIIFEAGQDEILVFERHFTE